MSRLTDAEARRLTFDEKFCECGHVYQRHPWEGNPRRPGYCLDCACKLRRDAVAQAEYRRKRAVAADPAHVHGSTHIAYACPGWVPMQLCDECGQPVENRLRSPKEPTDD